MIWKIFMFNCWFRRYRPPISSHFRILDTQRRWEAVKEAFSFFGQRGGRRRRLHFLAKEAEAVQKNDRLPIPGYLVHSGSTTGRGESDIVRLVLKVNTYSSIFNVKEILRFVKGNLNLNTTTFEWITCFSGGALLLFDFVNCLIFFKTGNKL